MSLATLYTVSGDSEFVAFATYEDASRAAPAVWGVLGPKYRPAVERDPAVNEAPALAVREAGKRVAAGEFEKAAHRLEPVRGRLEGELVAAVGMLDEQIERGKLGAMFMGAARMTPSDSIALLASADFVAFRVEDLGALADHLDTFVAENNLGESHVPTIANDLRRVLLASVGDETIVGAFMDHSTSGTAETLTWASADPAAAFGVVSRAGPQTVERVRGLAS